MKKKISLSLGLILILAIAGFVVWSAMAMPPMPEALEALTQPEGVSVSFDRWITLTPVQQNPPKIGFIFYPGARVDSRAYAPMLVDIARAGIQVYLSKMPLNMAVFDPNLADDIIQANPQIQTWVIAGHSLGGAMAAQYAYNHPNEISGLVLLAAYPVENNDLKDSSISVLTISGQNDGLASVTDIQASLALLPANATWYEIKGGNHAQMGWYGTQAGDLPATISREEQQKQIIQQLEQFLEKLERQNP